MDIKQTSQFFELVQIALGNRQSLSRIPSEDEWYVLYEMSTRQAVVGLIFEAVILLGEQNEKIKPPLGLLMEWIGVSEQIKVRNQFANSRSVDITKFFEKAGYTGCILKGQGNALMYSNPLCRIPGDIDIWLMPFNKKCKSIKEIIHFIRKYNPTSSARYHHIDYGDFNGVEVEIHYRPMYMFNPLHNMRLQKWFNEQREEQVNHKTKFNERETPVSTPTIAFNRIYQLSHISCHFFIEGVGLRQLIDFYYVLQYPVTEEQRKQDENMLRHLGLYKMAAAVMFVLKETCGLKQGQMIVPEDRKRGHFLLNEVMMAGNMGAYDVRLGKNNPRITRNLKRLRRNMRLIRYFPSECLCEPLFRVWHLIWRMWNNRNGIFMSSNNQSNRLIKWIVMFGDFVLLNAIILLTATVSWRINSWPDRSLEIFILVNNIALMLAQMRFSTIIHLRLVGAGDVLQRVVGLTVLHSVLAYVLLKVFDYYLPIGWMQFWVGTTFFVVLIIKRIIERWFIKLYRQAGRNTRAVTLVGSDPELIGIYNKLMNDPTLGYNILGYYGDIDLGRLLDEVKSQMPDGETKIKSVYEQGLKRLGSLEDFVNGLNTPDNLALGDELYLCVSRTEKSLVRRISRMCDHRVIRFYYVPVSVETMGLNLKREYLDDMEVFTTYENPLQNSVNRAVKRLFDIVLSLVFLIPTAFIFPIVWVMIKIQSPGPLFFKQKRTGLDGKDFEMLKFRSMHVNKDADRVQATKNDPRKFPFGNFMRKSNIDELPQFLNVLKGDMSIVGPRPHMLLHTEMYSELIDKYMVRHFVKPGLTGWAQVTGFRGETKELWQMEGRVKRDIWYMEHWSIWLDIRIIWLTAKTIFIHDKNAY